MGGKRCAEKKGDQEKFILDPKRNYARMLVVDILVNSPSPSSGGAGNDDDSREILLAEICQKSAQSCSRYELKFKCFPCMPDNFDERKAAMYAYSF